VPSNIPLLWLCGPPGVGKTTVAWEVYRRLADAGTAVAYVDVDQLGICYPEHDDDPGRHQLKARNIAALRANFGAAGAACLVVSGVVDATRGPDTDVVGEALVVCRLRADADQLVARLASRDRSSTDPAAAVDEAVRLDASAFTDWCLDTTDMSIVDVAEEVLGHRTWLEPARAHAGEAPLAHQNVGGRPGGRALWLCGPTGVGKSTVGFRAYLQELRAGVAAAFVDIEQLGFFGGMRDTEIRAQNLSSVWANFRAAGAEALVVVGPVDAIAERQRYEQALPDVELSWCRLQASPEELTRRILSRRAGGSWAQPGDRLRGRSAGHLTEVADLASRDASAQNWMANSVEVDGLSPDDAAARVLERCGWRTN
jgi:adenylylsulfate kinase-like enzyme